MLRQRSFFRSLWCGSNHRHCTYMNKQFPRLRCASFMKVAACMSATTPTECVSLYPASILNRFFLSRRNDVNPDSNQHRKIRSIFGGEKFYCSSTPSTKDNGSKESSGTVVSLEPSSLEQPTIPDIDSTLIGESFPSISLNSHPATDRDYTSTSLEQGLNEQRAAPTFATCQPSCVSGSSPGTCFFKRSDPISTSPETATPKSLSSSSTGTTQLMLDDPEISELMKKISKDEKLLRTAVGKMSPKNKKRWIQALIQQLELDLIDGGGAHSTDGSSSPLSPAETLASTANSATAALQHRHNCSDTSDAVDESSLSCSSIPKDHKDAADQVFRILDVNQDGFVGLREFRIWFSTYYLNRELEKKKGASVTVAKMVPVKMGDAIESAVLAGPHFGETFKLRSKERENHVTGSFMDRSPPSRNGTTSVEDGKIEGTHPASSETSDLSGLTRRTEVTDTLQSNNTSVVSESSFIQGKEEGNNVRLSTRLSQELLVSNDAGEFDRYSKMQIGDSDDADEDIEGDVEWTTLGQVVLRSSIPYLAFGVIDNGLMLTCGEWIDSTVAVRFCLSTMAAAGLGNTLSCATGVVTGGFIERMCLRSSRISSVPESRFEATLDINFYQFVESLLGIVSQYSPSLTAKQSLSIGVRNAHIVGSVVGIIVGCLIGMFPLLLVQKPPRISVDETDHYRRQ